MPNLHRHRFVRCLLILLLAASLLAVSCSAGDASLEVGDDTSVDTLGSYNAWESAVLTERADETDGVSRTYPGYTATILTDAELVFRFDDASAERYNRADAERRAALEKQLAISLTVRSETDAAAYLTAAAQANETPDLVELGSASDAGTLITGGHLADLGALVNFQLDNPAIDRVLTDTLSIANHTYLLFSDATPTDVLASSAVLVQTDAAAAADLRPDALMDEVRGGRWTVEAWLTAASAGKADLNDGAVIPFFVGGEGTIFSKDDKDIPAITIDAAFSKAYEAMQRAMSVPVADAVGGGVFRIGTLADLTDGSIALPMPTLDAGDGYRTSVDPAELPCLLVPVSPVDPGRTGDILTVYLAASTDTVSAVVREYLDANQTAEGGSTDMLDLILQNRFCSHGALFGWGALTESLRGSVGKSEADFLKEIDMQMTAASRAMQILVGRLQ